MKVKRVVFRLLSITFIFILLIQYIALAEAKENLIKNSGFEYGWNNWRNYSYTGIEREDSVDHTVSYAGTSSIKSHYFKTNNGSSGLYLASFRFPLPPGKYTLSTWAKSRYGKGRIELYSLSAFDCTIATWKAFDLTKDWQRYIVKLEIFC